MNNNEENKAVELTDEDLKQVSGGFTDPARGQVCIGDCGGYYLPQCRNTLCPYGRK